MPQLRSTPPVPPPALPPARTVVVPGRGEFFLRDSGSALPGESDDRPALLLLHGWTVSSDLNWHIAYGPLYDAGYRVLAIDHRGHGHGLRAPGGFRLTDCAADAAAVLRVLGTGPATIVGYSMGGAVAQLMARDDADVVSGVVLAATCQHFSDRETARVWKWMGPVGVVLGLAPRRFYTRGLQRNGLAADARAAWALGELRRNDALAVAEAGRELGRFDSRPWAAAARGVPAASIVTTADDAVAPAKQYELAAAFGARVFEVALDHLELALRPEPFVAALLSAVAAVTPGAA